MIHALDHGQDTFLAQPEWTTIPFNLHPKRKIDELLDIFALGAEPGRLGRTLSTLPPDKVISTALAIISKLLVIHKQLEDFYSRLQNESPQPMYMERGLLTKSDNTAVDPEFVFPPILWFYDLDSAATLTIYWSTLTMVSRRGQQLHISVS